MTSNGIVKDIRALLAQDRQSRTEVIALDFNLSTADRGHGVMRQRNQILKAENGHLRQHLGGQATEAPSLEKEATQTLDYTAGLGEKVENWSGKFIAEQKARAEAEARAARHGAEATHLKEENQLLRQRIESLPTHLAQEVWKLVEPIHAELEELRSVHSSGSHFKRRSVKVVQERGIVVGPRPPFDDSWGTQRERPSFSVPVGF